MKYVKLTNNIVTEIIPQDATPLSEWYPEDFAAQCVEAPNEVEQNWVYDPNTNTFSEPVPTPTPVDPDPSGAEIYSDIAKAIREGVDSI